MPGEIPVDAGQSDSLDVCLTCQQDNAFVGEQLSYAGEPVYAPIEYAGESIGCGCAVGACCGGAGDFSGYSSCTSCGSGGGFGGGFGGGYVAPLLGAAGVAVGTIALATNNSGKRKYKRFDPKPSSPFKPYDDKYDKYEPYDKYDKYEPYDKYDKYEPYDKY